MNIPENLRYTKDHEWIRVEDKVAFVGITDYAQGELGDIVFIEIETLEQHLEKEEVFGTIEAVKTVSDLFMPASGKVIEINDKLDDHPDLVNKDPYGEGWLIKVELDDENQVNSLHDAQSYKKMIEV
jgi:glycine cleavage system H protein